MNRPGKIYSIMLGLILLLAGSRAILAQKVSPDDSAICRECHIFARKPQGFPEDKIPVTMRKSLEEGKKIPQLKFWTKTRHFQVGTICTDCHDPYAVKDSKFLIEPEEKLCLGCHTTQREESELEYAHRQAKLGHCVICHSPHGSELEQGIRYDVNLLCTFCHESQKRLLALDFSHQTVVEENCVYCHQPHGSTVKARLKKPADDLCLDCHKEKEQDLRRAQVHQPLLAGQCLTCHNPHGADNRYRLIQEGRELCLRCHWEQAGEFTRVHYHSGAELKDDCLTCHAAHCADYQGLLISGKNRLCSSCHQEIFAEFAQIYHHPIEADDEVVSCLSCHRPHDSEAGRRLTKSGNDLCFNCHPEIEGIYLNSAHDDDDTLCTACHKPHGSSIEKQLILTQTQLCYLCHETTRSEFESTVHHPIIASPGSLYCTNCHNPHIDTVTQKTIDPDDTKILYGTLDANFCLRCHDGSPPSSVEASPTDRSGYTSSAHFTTGSKDCDDCHHHHGTNNAYMLTSSEAEEAFCYNSTDSSCHGIGDSGNDVQTAFESAYHHDVENLDDVECDNCHNVHLDTLTQKIVDPDDTDTLYGTLDTNFCLRCHDGSPPDSVRGSPVDESGFTSSAHATVSGSECNDCHHHHGTNNYGMVISGETEEAFCYNTEDGTCHGTGDSGTVVQTEFAEAHHHDVENSGDVECSNCHNWHIATTINKIVDPDDVGTLYGSVDSDFCLRCHDGSPPDSVGVIPTDISNFSGDTHDTEGYLCTECHEKHGSALANMLTTPIQGAVVTDTESACLACHDGAPATDVTVFSGKVHDTEGYTCTTCHDTHGSANSKNTLESEEALCYNTTDSGCHGVDDTGQDVGTAFAKLTKMPVASSGVVECTNCHSAHISTATAPLVNPNDTSKMYGLTGTVDNDFCFECHGNESLPPGVSGYPANIEAECETATTINSDYWTDPVGPNPPENEHFYHQDDGDCVDCHEYHGSDGTNANGVTVRGALLKDWIQVDEFQYKEKKSCSTNEPAELTCHP